MEFNDYIEAELYILVPVLYAVGSILKKSSAVKDRWIPIILGALGIILAIVYKIGIYSPYGIREMLPILYAGFTQGVLCAAGSVYTNNIVKQMKKGKDENLGESNNQAG